MQYIQWEVQNQIGTLTLNRPEKRNALNEDVVQELHQTLKQAVTDDQCRVVVMRSSGSAFCAGADLGYLQQLQHNSYEENLQDSKQLMKVFKTIYTMPKVVISMVDGPAIAGGCGLATIADYCFASPESKFGYTEARIGFVPAIVMVFLLRKIGEAKAREILLSGEVFDADRAWSLDMVNAVVPSGELEAYTYDFAAKLIHKNSSQSMAMIKKMIAEVPEKTLDEALDYAANMNATMRESDDCKKGIASFLNKEKIKWS